MKHGVAKRSSIFLLELIVAIMFFAIASGVCVRVFVASRVKSNKAAELNHAVMVCQSAADIVYHSNGGGTLLSDSFFANSSDADGVYSYFDSNWTACEKDSASYVVKINQRIDGQMLYGDISAHIKSSEETIYSLHITKYMPTMYV